MACVAFERVIALVLLDIAVAALRTRAAGTEVDTGGRRAPGIEVGRRLAAHIGIDIGCTDQPVGCAGLAVEFGHEGETATLAVHLVFKAVLVSEFAFIGAVDQGARQPQRFGEVVDAFQKEFVRRRSLAPHPTAIALGTDMIDVRLAAGEAEEQFEAVIDRQVDRAAGTPAREDRRRIGIGDHIFRQVVILEAETQAHAERVGRVAQLGIDDAARKLPVAGGDIGVAHLDAADQGRVEEDRLCGRAGDFVIVRGIGVGDVHHVIDGDAVDTDRVVIDLAAGNRDVGRTQVLQVVRVGAEMVDVEIDVRQQA